MNAPAVLELPLDDALLKVLSSESRREILRLLRERRMTGAELATRLDLGKPAVAEHLKKLQEAELIERFDDPERRWVYYNLSSRGRGILEPQRVRFYLVMAVAALGLMVGIALALAFVVLTQSPADLGAGTLGDGTNASGDGADGILGQAGTSPGGANPALVPFVGTTTSKAPDAPAPQVYTGEHAAPQPVGNVTPPGPAEVGNSIILDGPISLVPITPSDGGVQLTAVYVYRAQDLDLVNHTVTLHLLPLNATALAEANLTEAVKQAALVPNIGMLIEVPDTFVLPEGANTTATLPMQALEPPAVEPAPAPAPVREAPEAPATPMPEVERDETPAAGGVVQPESGAAAPAFITVSVPADPPGPTGPVGPTGPAVSASDGAAVGSGGLAANQPAAPGTAATPVPEAQATVGGARASIPLVSLLAAALMVSIYLPTRRK